GVAELQHVAEDRSDRHALSDRMRTRGRPDNPEVRLARCRPGTRSRQALQMFLHSARSSNFRRRQASVSSIRMISKFDAWSGLGTFFSSTFSIVMPSTTTVPCTRSTDTTLPSRPRNPPRMTRTVSPFRTTEGTALPDDDRVHHLLAGLRGPLFHRDDQEVGDPRRRQAIPHAAVLLDLDDLHDLRAGVVDALEAGSLREAPHLPSRKTLHAATP